MPAYSRYPTLEIVCDAPPDRLNEDAWLVMPAVPMADRLLFAVLDGATTRLTPPPLQHFLDSLPERPTPAAYAARVTRAALAHQIAEGDQTDLRAMLVAANNALGRALTRIFGELSLEGMRFPEEVYTSLAAEPRSVRLGLPACVVTLAEYDPDSRTLQYAHAGDTLLLVAYEDGSVTVPTRQSDASLDSAVKRTMLKLREIYPDRPLRELVHQPEIRKMNLHAGLRHNYVDEHGLPQPKQGIGVIDGLPELRYFVQTGQVELDGASFVCAMTDGLEWPASAEETFAPDETTMTTLLEERRAYMAHQINIQGLAGYLEILREAETYDPDHEQFPRMKTHDDATGILLRLN